MTSYDHAAQWQLVRSLSLINSYHYSMLVETLSHPSIRSALGRRISTCFSHPPYHSNHGQLMMHRNNRRTRIWQNCENAIFQSFLSLTHQSCKFSMNNSNISPVQAIAHCRADVWCAYRSYRYFTFLIDHDNHSFHWPVNMPVLRSCILNLYSI